MDTVMTTTSQNGQAPRVDVTAWRAVRSSLPLGRTTQSSTARCVPLPYVTSTTAAN